MKTPKLILILAGCLALAVPAPAQFFANWSGGAGDNDWNNPLNWDTLEVPGPGTNAIIGAAFNVDYNTPMAAPSFSILSCAGVLNINAAGFTVDGAGDGAVGFAGSASRLAINPGGAVSLTAGGLTLSNAAGLSLASGGSLTVAGNFLLGRNGTGNTGFATNDGGFISAAATGVNPNNNSTAHGITAAPTTWASPRQTQRGRQRRLHALGTEGTHQQRIVTYQLRPGGSDGNSFLTAYSPCRRHQHRRHDRPPGHRQPQFPLSANRRLLICPVSTASISGAIPLITAFANYAVLGGTKPGPGFRSGKSRRLGPHRDDSADQRRQEFRRACGGFTSAVTLNTKTIA
jgi:hypothetical protein